jgi:gamma-glutamyl:cysteine ligase YbdK (ATP-grasp superfamily)
LHLFEGYGIELEYMIVRKDDLSVMPITDEVMREKSGAYNGDVENGQLVWSNELVLHVIELKTNGPVNTLRGVENSFKEGVSEINSILEKHGCTLLPGGMHPFMDPSNETRLWPHDSHEIYNAYHTIFNCYTHGWANLQSIHINLPFGNDNEFGRLHAAIRMILPILPAIAASSPIMEGNVTGIEDNRLDVYRNNQKLIPSITGLIIPEAVFTRRDYEEVITQKVFSDIRNFDKEGILKNDWLNSRGATARFDRSSIEIRLLDIQECPLCDIAICSLVTGAVRALVRERFAPFADQKKFSTELLHDILLQVIKNGGNTVIDNREYLRGFGFRGRTCRALDLWSEITGRIGNYSDIDLYGHPLSVILEKGNLSQRITKALDGSRSKDSIVRVYKKLAGCLSHGEIFQP